MTLSIYQFAFNGLTFGAGTPYIVENVDGLGGTSPLRIQDDNRGYIDGSYSGRDFYDGRTVTFDILITGDSTHNAQYYYKTLQAAFAPQPLGYYVDPTGTTPAANQLQLFQFQLTSDTGPKRMYGRGRGVTLSITPEFGFGYIMCRAEFFFPDPRYYDETASTGTGSSITLSNTGWATSCPVITIASPSASGNITDGTTTMYFSSVITTSPLTIDLLQRIVYVGNYPSRNVLNASTTGWLSIAPNTSSVTWTSTVGSMSIPYRNAYV
jgi:hypothetical protein